MWIIDLEGVSSNKTFVCLMCTVFLLGISGNYTADVKLTPIIKSVRGSIYLLEAMSGGRLH